MPWEFWEDLIIIIYAITHPHEYVLFTHYFLVLSVTVVPNAVNNISERRRIYVSFFFGGGGHTQYYKTFRVHFF